MAMTGLAQAQQPKAKAPPPVTQSAPPAAATTSAEPAPAQPGWISRCTSANRCFTSAPIPADLLAAMKTGKQLKVSFQTLSKETVTIPMPLADFAAAFERIK